jgi:hypothetical protein
MRARPASHYRSIDACHRHVSSPTSNPLLSHPHINSFLPQCRHLCAYTLEPSHHRSCGVASCRHCHLHSALLIAAPLGCRCQPLDVEALEQPASLAESAPRGHLVPLSSSPVPTTYGQMPPRRLHATPLLLHHCHCDLLRTRAHPVPLQP